MIREILTESWSLKKRWILFTGGLCLLMLVYHGSAVVESTYISDLYWPYKTSPPPTYNKLINRVSFYLIKNISISVNEMRDPNIDESGGVWSYENHHSGLFYLLYAYMDIKNSIDEFHTKIIENKILVTEQYIMDNQIPYSYDIDIDGRLYYGQDKYPSDHDYPYSGVNSSDYDDGAYLNQMELRWLKTQGEKEIWRRVQERFQWD